MASIKQIKNKNGDITSYQIVVTNGRTSKQATKTVKASFFPPTWSKKTLNKELSKIAAEFENQVKLGQLSPTRKTFKEYANYVIEMKERNGIKTRTIESYRYLMGRICDSKNGIGHLKIDKIRPETINRFYSWLLSDGQSKNGGKLSTKTVHEYHSFVHMVLQQAYKEGLVIVNVADRSTPPKVQRHEAEYYEIETIQEIIAALQLEDLKWQAFVYLLIDTGARRGEVLGLRWCDINFDKGTVLIYRNAQISKDKGIYITTPKTGKSRIISISPNTLEKLLLWKKEQNERQGMLFDVPPVEGYIFAQDTKDWPMNPHSVSWFFKRFSKRHNLPNLHAHAFRHSQASILLHAGVGIETVKNRLGHDKASTTLDIYGHMLAKADTEAMNVINSTIFEVHEPDMNLMRQDV